MWGGKGKAKRDKEREREKNRNDDRDRWTIEYETNQLSDYRDVGDEGEIWRTVNENRLNYRHVQIYYLHLREGGSDSNGWDPAGLPVGGRAVSTQSRLPGEASSYYRHVVNSLMAAAANLA
ncbi:hypothetical protein PoB_006238200 [Plakobranchus ocellatus]|uniref:Uncharacterized protein n=1 Tax=Plakobranchus ocellatus TaxID=259542 RepID=A0AAV4CVE1_9GAST|nr:hypothetical protein PoB_006238200 [Plakobranchus ocellatus]